MAIDQRVLFASAPITRVSYKNTNNMQTTAHPDYGRRSDQNVSVYSNIW